MSIEQAVLQITQTGNYTEKLWAIESIIQSLKTDEKLTNTLNIPMPREKFVVKPFRIGTENLPSREELYDERTEQIFGDIYK